MAPRRGRGDDPAADDHGTSPEPPSPSGSADDPIAAEAEAEAAPSVDPGPTPPVDDEDPGTGEHAAADRVPVRRLIDGRTLAVCTLIALVAALVTGLAVSRFTGDDDAGDPQAGEGELIEAEEAPDVAIEGFDGSEVSLTDYAGQPLVVNFWGSWCVPCVEEMPDFERVHDSLGDQVAFLGVNVRDDPEAARALAERTGVTYDLARDVDGDLSRELGITNWPTTVLILPDGTVVDYVRRQVSAERLCEKINQSLMAGALTECG